MNTIKLQQRGILTLPKKLRASLGLIEGQVLRIEEKNGQIILEPQKSDSDSELMKAIKQVIDDIKAGNFIEFSSVPEFHKKVAHYEN